MGFFSNIFSSSTSSDQLEVLIKEGSFLVDVRTPAEFADGHVKSSTNIPLDQIENHLNVFKEKKHIVVFCRSGNRSAQAKSILEKNGFSNVTNGGTWQDINDIING